MPFSLRLDPDTEAKIRKLTAATGRLKSEVVREAVAQYAPDRRAVLPKRLGESAFDRLKPFIGAIGTGGAKITRDRTHAKYRKLLQRKHSCPTSSLTRAPSSRSSTGTMPRTTGVSRR